MVKFGDLLISTFLFGVFGWALAVSSDWPWEARALPNFASAFGILLVLVLLASRLRQTRLPDFHEILPRKDMIALLGFMASVAGVVLLGLFWGGLLLVFCHIYFSLGRNLRNAMLATLPLLLLPLLERALQVQFFQGLFRLSSPY